MIKLLGAAALAALSMGVASATVIQDPEPASEPGRMVVEKRTQAVVVGSDEQDGERVIILVQPDDEAPEDTPQAGPERRRRIEVRTLPPGERPGPGPGRPRRPVLQRDGLVDRQGRDDVPAPPAVRVYLDAARRLYREAARAAEAGQFERAADLARAAEQIARAPRLLQGIDQAPAQDRTMGPGPRREAMRQRMMERRFGPGPEGRPGRRPQAKDAPRPEPSEPKPDAGAKADDAGPLVGVGLALAAEDGQFVVQRVLPEGPAGQDGRIKPGDRLLGIQQDGGQVTRFENKDLVDIVKLIRGPADSKVTLLIKPEGSDEEQSIELTRRSIDAPAEGGEAPEPAEGGIEKRIREFLRKNLEVDEAGPLVGVGLALQSEAGQFIVREVLEGSPAAQSGQIKPGDRIVGVRRDGELVKFEGQELVKIVEQIRGPEGSKVTLVVRPAGSDEEREVSLTRKPIDLPAEKPEAESKEGEPTPKDTESRDKGPEQEDDGDDDKDHQARKQAMPFRIVVPDSDLVVDRTLKVRPLPMAILKRLSRTGLTGPVQVEEVAPGRIQIRIEDRQPPRAETPAAPAPSHDEVDDD